MMTCARLAGGITLWMLWLCTAAAGYGQTTVTLTGTVTDAQGGVMPGATVVAVYEPTGVSSQAATRADGRYTVSDLRPGPYRVTVLMAGFRDTEPRELALDAGQERQLDFRLQIAPMSEEFTVRGGTALARDEKRSAPNIIDVVSADAMALPRRQCGRSAAPDPGRLARDRSGRGPTPIASSTSRSARRSRAVSGARSRSGI